MSHFTPINGRRKPELPTGLSSQAARDNQATAPAATNGVQGRKRGHPAEDPPSSTPNGDQGSAPPATALNEEQNQIEVTPPPAKKLKMVPGHKRDEIVCKACKTARRKCDNMGRLVARCTTCKEHKRGECEFNVENPTGKDFAAAKETERKEWCYRFVTDRGDISKEDHVRFQGVTERYRKGELSAHGFQRELDTLILGTAQRLEVAEATRAAADAAAVTGDPAPTSASAPVTAVAAAHNPLTTAQTCAAAATTQNPTPPLSPGKGKNATGVSSLAVTAGTASSRAPASAPLPASAPASARVLGPARAVRTARHAVGATTRRPMSSATDKVKQEPGVSPAAVSVVPAPAHARARARTQARARARAETWAQSQARARARPLAPAPASAIAPAPSAAPALPRLWAPAQNARTPAPVPASAPTVAAVVERRAADPRDKLPDEPTPKADELRTIAQAALEYMEYMERRRGWEIDYPVPN